jgi:shikimate kinase
VKVHVALVGFMAAGKTTIGRRLARELDIEFVDTDALVAERHGPIHEIFATEGEARFREYERAAAETAFSGAAKVVSLGGGAVTHPPTRALIAEHAVRIYIAVTPEKILGRLRRSRTIRPVIGEQPTLAAVRTLLAAREPLYRESEIVVEGGLRSRVALAKQIAKLVRLELGA